MSNVYSVVLDGNDAYSATDHADFKPTGNFTIGGWIKTSSANDEQVIMQSYSEGSSKLAGFLLRIKTTKVSFRSAKNSGSVAGTDYQVVTSTSAFNDGNWHWVVAVYDGSKIYIYVDGNSAATAVTWANAPAYQATNYVRVGCENDTGTNLAFFNGSLDEIFVINGTAWNAAKVTAMYKKFLTGETNLKAYYQLENNANDSTAGAHTLTAISDPAFDNTSVPFTAIPYTESFSETITISEPSFVLAMTRKFLDTLTLSEVFAKRRGKNFSDLITLSETFKEAVNKILSDTLTLSETFKKATTRKFSDIFTLSDTFRVEKAKDFDDTITVSDIIRKQATRIFTDTITLSETFKNAVSKTFTETAITITDTLSKIQRRFWSFTETISITDIIGFARGTVISFLDTLTITETMGITKARLFFDTITMSDWIERLRNFVAAGIPRIIRSIRDLKAFGFLRAVNKPTGVTDSINKPGGVTVLLDKPSGMVRSKDKPTLV